MLRGSRQRFPSLKLIFNSVADPDPGSGAFLTPGFGMGKKIRIQIRDEKPGHISESLE
jgi:hypothetical protein